MVIICKKATKRLVKGLRYDVLNLYNDGSNQRWIEGKVEIKEIGRYTVENFTDINGNPLPKINIITPRTVFKNFTFDELKEGEILVCITDYYKTLSKNSMYRISKLIEKKIEYTTFNGTKHQRSEKSIKFEGIKRSIKFSNWKFRKLTSEETREIQLSSLLSGEKPNVITSSDVRKIDLVLNKDKELMSILSKSILDSNRHHLSILDWAIQKTGTNYSINKDDYQHLLNLPLKDILDKIK